MMNIDIAEIRTTISGIKSEIRTINLMLAVITAGIALLVVASYF
ncbi:hypothetical protein [Ferrovum sp.]|nr:hypothetical protein [Ferrovum sp.]